MDFNEACELLKTCPLVLTDWEANKQSYQPAKIVKALGAIEADIGKGALFPNLRAALCATPFVMTESILEKIVEAYYILTLHIFISDWKNGLFPLRINADNLRSAIDYIYPRLRNPTRTKKQLFPSLYDNENSTIYTEISDELREKVVNVQQVLDSLTERDEMIDDIAPNLKDHTYKLDKPKWL